MGGYDTALPFDVPRFERAAQRVALEELAHRGNLAQIVRRDGSDLETTRALGDDQALGRKAIEDLAQCAYRRAIRGPHPLERQFLARRQATVDDVGPDAAVGLFADRRDRRRAQRG